MSEKKRVDTDQFGQKAETLLLSLYPQIFQRFCRYPLWSAAGLVIILIGIHLAIVFIFGTFQDSEAILGMVADRRYIPTMIVQIPMFFYVLWLPRHLGSTFDKLVANRIFEKDKIEFDAHIEEDFTSVRVRRFVYGLAVVGWISQAISFMPIESNPSTWMNSPFPAYVLHLPTIVPFWMFVGYLLVSYVMALRLINNVFSQNTIVVHPLHPDKCGGFRPLGSYAFKFTFFILILGMVMAAVLIVAIIEDRTTEFYWIGSWLVFSMFLIPVLFTLPLFTAQQAMAGFRNALIDTVSLRYSSKITEALNPETMEATLTELNHLKELQKHAMAYPTWPSNLQIGLGVAINALLPLVTTLVGLLLESYFG